MVEIRTPTEADIQYLADNIRDADRAELSAAGYDDVYMAVKSSVESSRMAYVAIAHGEIAAIYGVVPDGFNSGRGIMWLLGTDALRKYRRDFIRVSSRTLREFLNIYEILWNCVDMSNELAIRWLKFIGCEFGRPFPVNKSKFVKVELHR